MATQRTVYLVRGDNAVLGIYGTEAKANKGVKTLKEMGVLHAYVEAWAVQ